MCIDMRLQQYISIAIPLFFVLSTSLSSQTAADRLCTSIDELNESMKSGCARSFAIQGTVLSADFIAGLVIEDKSGISLFSNRFGFKAETGNAVRINGYTYTDKRGRPWLEIENGTVTGIGKLTEPESAGVEQIALGNFDNRLVRTEGTIVDAISDEIDKKVVYFFLSDKGKTVTLACKRTDFPLDVRKLINAAISVTGFCTPYLGDMRRFQTRGIITNAKNLSIVRQPPADPFNVPEMDRPILTDPESISSLTRRRVDGTVLARWNGDRFLLATTNTVLAIVSVADRGNLPTVGSFVRITGFPETDTYNLNFTRSIWRPEERTPVVEMPPVETTADKIAPFDERCQYDFSFNGKTVRIDGTIRHIFKTDQKIRLMLENGKHVVTIDASESPGAVENISIGCGISVTGICIMDVDAWRPSSPLPQIRDFSVITRSDRDIRLLHKPSWWTSRRLSVLCTFLAMSFIAITAWNRWLSKLVDRRGHELFQSNIARLSANLKVNERTRLAVELHDALSQNLTGVSLQLDAVKRFADSDIEKRNRHLDIAVRSLKSCRDELRNCLWDLRNHALEEKDMNEAIRRTVEPFVGEAALKIRFSIPREQISDNTAHALMRIIRELATNACRHGAATTVRIAGALENGKLLFSVADNGRGFDPRNRPDVSSGHFGLEGIRERIYRLAGNLEIKSSPGTGTTVTISLPA